MAASKSASRMDYWRDYFKASNGDIFELIENAIMVAASDHPKEFRIKRDCIAQTLFSCKSIKFSGCDKVEEQDDDDDKDHVNVRNHQIGNCNYGVEEALTDEIEVMKIKKIVDNHQHESESALYNSLRNLQLMDISFEILKETMIGKSVNGLRKHASKDVSGLAKTLIESWKLMVDEHVKATERTVISEATPESLNPSVLDDEEDGLPSPPLDDLPFFDTLTSSDLELSQIDLGPFIDGGFTKFFDGIEDYENSGNSGGFDKNHNEQKSEQEKPSNGPIKSCKNEPDPQLVKKQQTVVKLVKPSGHQSGRGKTIKLKAERKLQNVPKTPQQNNQRTLGETTTNEEKFETAKRKLHEQYQQVEKDSGNSGGFNKNHNEQKSEQENPSNGPFKVCKNEPDPQLMKKQQTVVKPVMPSGLKSGRGKTITMNAERKVQNVPKIPQQNDLRASRETTTYQDKFETAKRKLHERYQEVEKAKKQRTIQVMELHELPKPKGQPLRSQPNVRPAGNRNRRPLIK